MDDDDANTSEQNHSTSSRREFINEGVTFHFPYERKVSKDYAFVLIYLLFNAAFTTEQNLRRYYPRHAIMHERLAGCGVISAWIPRRSKPIDKQTNDALEIVELIGLSVYCETL